MVRNEYPVIDTVATGDNIRRLREKRGLTVKDLQSYFGFEMPQAIYKWQRGESLPSVDNLYALGRLLDVPLDEIIIQTRPLNIRKERQRTDCRSDRFLAFIPLDVSYEQLRGEYHRAAYGRDRQEPCPHPCGYDTGGKSQRSGYRGLRGLNDRGESHERERDIRHVVQE